MPLFEVAVIKKPTSREVEDGGADALVMAPKAVVAKDEKGAIVKAIVGLTFDPDRCEVLVRPFK